MIVISPSILAADMANLGQAVRDADVGGADAIHIDVMDGRFVPNITIGIPVVAALRPLTRLPLDVHLMIDQPERHLDAFAAAGADSLTVHVEVSPHLQRTLTAIRALGKQAGVALNPSTPVIAIEDVLDDVDRVLIMSVNPGFGGQRFLPRTVEKLARVRALVARAGRPIDLQVDGGIDPTTVPLVVAAGATNVVAGSAVYGAAGGVESAIRALRAAAERGVGHIAAW